MRLSLLISTQPFELPWQIVVGKLMHLKPLTGSKLNTTKAKICRPRDISVNVIGVHAAMFYSVGLCSILKCCEEYGIHK
jgi:hypothetical protein